MDIEHLSSTKTNLDHNDVQYFRNEATIIVDEASENLPTDNFYTFYGDEQNFSSSKNEDVIVDDIIEESLEYYQFNSKESNLEQSSTYVDVEENEVCFNFLYFMFFFKN